MFIEVEIQINEDVHFTKQNNLYFFDLLAEEHFSFSFKLQSTSASQKNKKKRKWFVYISNVIMPVN